MGSEVTLPSFSSIFEEKFPYFLSLGMSFTEFWDEEPSVARAYLKADEIKTERINSILWLQGQYIRSAMYSSVGNMLGKKKIEYVKEPFPLSEKEQAERKEKERQEKFNRMKEKMTLLAKGVK